MYRWYSGFILMLGVAVLSVFATQAQAVPSFSRQTGMTCDSCHTSAPGLTKVGREFKLNGYQMDGMAQVHQSPGKSSPGQSINKIPQLSVLFKAGEEGVSKKVDHHQNPSAEYPAAFVLYYAGRVAPHFGAFLDAAYSGHGGHFGLDNADFRYARDTKLFSHNLIWGLDVNNSPSEEDVWNSSPQWSGPYLQHGGPVPVNLVPFIDKMKHTTVGAGAYQYWNGLVYTYAAFYQAAKQGHLTPNYRTSTTIKGANPYFRIALTPINNFEIGSFGVFAKNNPANGYGDEHFADIGFDSQYQWYPNHQNIVTAHLRYIHQHATGLAKATPGYSGSNSLNSNFVDFDTNWIYKHRYGLTFAYFYANGDRSNYYRAKYGAGGAGGFAKNTRPKTSGEIAQAFWFPWQNVRLGLSYTAYNSYNGSSGTYNSSGRSASDNNTWNFDVLLGW